MDESALWAALEDDDFGDPATPPGAVPPALGSAPSVLSSLSVLGGPVAPASFASFAASAASAAYAAPAAPAAYAAPAAPAAYASYAAPAAPAALPGLPVPLPPPDAACDCAPARVLNRSLEALGLRRVPEDLPAPAEASEGRAASEEQCKMLSLERERLRALVAKQREGLVQADKDKAALEGRIKAEADREELARSLSCVAAKNTQFAHEMKKREKEFERLQERLRRQIMDKQEARHAPSIDMPRGLHRPASARRAEWPDQKRIDEDLRASVASAWDSRVASLLSENELLRQDLRQEPEFELQLQELSAVHGPPTLCEPAAAQSCAEMPAQMCHASLAARLEALRARVRAAVAPGEAGGAAGVAAGRPAETEEGRRLAECVQIIEEQDRLLQQAIDAAQCPEEDSRFDASRMALEDLLAGNGAADVADPRSPAAQTAASDTDVEEGVERGDEP
eukprot:m51a1_g10370 hypothetical protein (453) ;mRNA; r:94410-96460